MAKLVIFTLENIYLGQYYYINAFCVNCVNFTDISLVRNVD